MEPNNWIMELHDLGVCPFGISYEQNENKNLFRKNISPRLSFLVSVFNPYLFVVAIWHHGTQVFLRYPERTPHYRRWQLRCNTRETRVRACRHMDTRSRIGIPGCRWGHVYGMVPTWSLLVIPEIDISNSDAANDDKVGITLSKLQTSRLEWQTPKTSVRIVVT